MADLTNLTTEINKLISTKNDLKTVANENGGAITNDTPFSGYAPVFSDLLANSGSEPVPYDGEFLVRVIDYDGTILKEAYLNTGDTFTLPDTPTNDRLTFQSWSSPVDIVNNTVTVEDDNIFIGAIYETKSGATEIDISINENTGLDFALYNCTGLSTVDWGDGTTSTGSSGRATHTYASAGEYTIKAYGITATDSYIFGHTQTLPNYTVKKCFFGNTLSSLGNYALPFISNIEIISFPNSLGGSINYQFQTCNMLKTIILPPNITALGNRCIYSMAAETVVLPKGITITNPEAFGSLNTLKNISLPNTITTLGNSCLQLAFSLYRVKVPNSVSIIGNNFCYGNLYLKSIILGENIESIGSGFIGGNGKNIGLIDFSKALQVPTLGGALTIGNTACEIRVPRALYSDFAVATNWADVAQYIKPVGTYSLASFIFSELYSADTALNGEVATENEVNITFETSGGTTEPKYFVNGLAVRLYTSNYVGITSSTVMFNRLEVTGESLGSINTANASGTWSASEDGTSATWTGLYTTELALVPTGSCKISSIKVHGVKE